MHLALLVVQVLFGLWPVAGAAVLRQVSPPSMIGVRTILATPILFLMARRTGASLPSRRDLLALAALAFLGVAANQLLYAEGLLRAGPINAAVLMVTIPALTLAVAMLSGRERPASAKIGGVLLALAGAAIILRIERLDLSSETVTGNFLILGNATCYACYLVFARPVVGRVGATAAIAWVFFFGSIEALPFTVGPMLATPWSALPLWVFAMFVFIVLGPSVGAYGLNAYALRYVDASIVAVYVTLQPLISAAASWWLLQERITGRVLAGGAVIVAGVFLASRSSGDQK